MGNPFMNYIQISSDSCFFISFVLSRKLILGLLNFTEEIFKIYNMGARTIVWYN